MHSMLNQEQKHSIVLWNRKTNKAYKKRENIFTFVLFSFLNSFFPIFLCMISALIPEYGAQAVMAVGFVSPFQLGFMQLGVSFATWCFYSIIKKIRQSRSSIAKIEFNATLSSSVYLSIFMGIILTVFYVVCSYLYMYFSCNRPNTQLTLEYGYNFIFTSIPYILLICLKSILVLYVFYHKKSYSIYFEIFFTIFSLLFSFLLSVLTNINTYGVGAGESIVMILYIVFLLIFINTKLKFKFYKLSLSQIKSLFSNFKFVLKDSAASISMAFFKGLALLLLGIIITTDLKDFVPLSFQMARVLWFNLMYCLPFIGIGVANAIEFSDIYVTRETLELNSEIRIRYWKYLIISMLITTGLCVGFTYLINPLTSLYIMNNGLVVEMVPPFQGSIPVNRLTGKPIIDLSNINNLPPRVLPQIPIDLINAVKTNDTNLIQTELEKWIQTPEMKQWKDWIENTNLKDFKLWFITHIDKIFSQTHTTEQQFLIDLKDWYVNYIQYTSLDVNVISNLLLYNTQKQINESTSILVHVLDHKAYAYIYICVYSILCVGWTILLPAMRGVKIKRLPQWFVCLVYALAIGFVVSFGVIFSLYFDKLWPNATNYFKYMDAWTFPLFAIASIVSLYFWVKWIIINIKQHKISKNNMYV